MRLNALLPIRGRRAAQSFTATLLAMSLGACLHGAPAPTGQVATSTSQASRADLEARATELERLASSVSSKSEREVSMAELAMVRDRLRDGDYLIGDRIALSVQGEPTLSDTFAVRAGQLLYLPNIPEIPLKGVLRSEIDEYLTTQLGKYVREPVVRVSSLVRVAVLGEVLHPGFYPLPVDLPLSEVIMRAGGPTPRADLTKTRLQRGTVVLSSGHSTQQALGKGLTLDDLGVRAGDELYVGVRRQVSWQSIATTLTAITGLTVGLLAATRSF